MSKAATLVLSNHVYVPEGRFHYLDLYARRLGAPSVSSDDLSTASGVIVPHWFYDHRGNYTEGTRYQYRGDDPTLTPLSPSDFHGGGHVEEAAH